MKQEDLNKGFSTNEFCECCGKELNIMSLVKYCNNPKCDLNNPKIVNRINDNTMNKYKAKGHSALEIKCR